MGSGWRGVGCRDWHLHFLMDTAMNYRIKWKTREEAAMTSEEMQVLRALEVGLECAEEVLVHEEAMPLAHLRPRGVQLAKAEAQQIRDAIEVVKRWETKE